MNCQLRQLEQDRRKRRHCAWRVGIAGAGAFLAILSCPAAASADSLAVVPILIGPLQVLLAILPAILVALGGIFVAILKPSALKAGVKVLWRNKLATVIAAGGIVGAVYLVPHVFGTGPQAGAAYRAGQDWPAFRGGPQRRGAAPDSPDPDTGGVVWSFSSEAKTFYSSPAVVGNRVYAASAEVGIFGGGGAIYCLDADTGGVDWKYAPSDFRPTFSSPAVAGNFLVCGEGLHQTTDARITCLRADTGQRLWELRTASHVESSPCIYQGKVYIGAGDDGLYCLDLKPGDDDKPQVLWHLPGKDYPDCETSPIAHEGKVYFGLGEGGCAVCCVDADSGRLLWRTPAAYPVFASPAVADGKVFVGMGNGNMVQAAEQVREERLRKLRERGASQEEIAAAAKKLQPAGEVWALDAETGKRLWSYKLPRTVLGAIAVADGRLYFGCRDGRFVCLTTDGQLVNAWNAYEPVLTSPAVGNENVYFMTAGGRLYGLDRRGLEPVWEVSAGTGKEFISSPTLARGHVFVGTQNNGLLCLGQPSQQKREHVWAGHLGGPGKSGWADGSPLPKVGSFAWRYPGAQSESATDVAAPAAWGGSALYVGVHSAGRSGLVKLVPPRRGGGARSRRAGPEEKWFYPLDSGLHQSAAVKANRVYLIDGKPGDAGRRLHCLDAASGGAVWTRPVAAAAAGHVLAAAGRLFVFDAAETLSCFETDGDAARGPAWSQTVKNPVGSAAVAAGAVLACSASPPEVIAIDAATGQQRWRSSLPAAPTTGPAATEDLIAVGTAQGITVLSVVNGAVLWSVDCGPVAGPIVFDEKRLACTTASSEIVLLDWYGRQIQRITGASPSGPQAAGWPPIAGMPPILCGDQLLYCSATSLVRAELEDGKWSCSQWRDISWLGRPSAPPVMIASRVYCGVQGKGLVCVGPRE